MDEGSGHPVAVDSSGEGNNGTLTNMNTTGNATSGWQGADGGQWDDRNDMRFSTGDQLRFDGVNDSIKVPDSSSLDVTEAITMAAWIRRDVVDVRHAVVAKYDTVDGERTYALDIDSNNLTMFLGNAPGVSYYVATASKTTIQADTWYHVVGTWDKNGDTKLHLFVNGLEETYSPQDTKTDDICNSSIDVLIGTRKGTEDRYFNGSIDEVRIYNRALSEDEIYRQYIRSKYAANAPTTVLGAAAPVGTTPPAPTNLQNTTSNYWVNYTWQAGTGTGVLTDGYNVSTDDGWYNRTGTSLNSDVGAGNWSNITVWAWNKTGDGNMSATNVSDKVQAPAAPVPSDGNGGGTGGGGGGTYPPGWFGTPAPTVTATKAPAASATGTATDAPSGERVTPTPTKRPDATKTTTPTATETAKKDTPGFTAVFAIAGLLAVAYAMMRRRE